MPNWPSDSRLVGLEDSIPSVLPNADGSLWERLAYLGSIGGNFGGFLPRINRRFNTPVNVTISGPTTLTERFNYFNDLTIAAGQVLTGLAGCTFVIVENTLTFANATSQIKCDGLGAMGGVGALTGSGNPGYGGGAFAFYNVSTGTSLVSRQAGINEGLNYAGGGGAAIAIFPPSLQVPMADGSTGTAALGTLGGNGQNWPALAGGVNTMPDVLDITIIDAIMELLKARTDNHATYGSVGGGGGSSGAGGTTAGTGGTLGSIGTAGKNNASAAGSSHGGGSGFGGGGAGGSANTPTGGTGGNGGRGGGVLVVLAKNIIASGGPGGLITANGANGANGAGTNSGGGGGGGGGCAVLIYEALTGTLPTMQANGGTGGNKAGTGGNGGNGGTGIARAIKVRSGV